MTEPSGESIAPHSNRRDPHPSRHQCSEDRGAQRAYTLRRCMTAPPAATPVTAGVCCVVGHLSPADHGINSLPIPGIQELPGGQEGKLNFVDFDHFVAPGIPRRDTHRASCARQVSGFRTRMSRQPQSFLAPLYLRRLRRNSEPFLENELQPLWQSRSPSLRVGRWRRL